MVRAILNVPGHLPAMPKAASTNAVEQAQNYQRRARELIQKSERKAVDALLAQNPHLAAPVLDHLASLGYKQNATVGPLKETPSAFKSAMEQRDAIMKQQKSTPLRIEDDPSVPPEDIIPSKYWTLGSLSVNLFVDKVLPSLEPISLSKANLKVMIARGDSVGNKSNMCKLLEFMTGAAPDFQMNGSMRRWSCLIKFLNDSNIDKDRRAQQLMLPLDWTKVGIYMLDIQGDNVWVIHIQSNKKIDFSNLVPDQVVDKTTLQIDFNWSDARVALTSQGPWQMKPIPLTCHFDDQEDSSGMPSAKKPRTQPAIMDGVFSRSGSQESGAASSNGMGMPSLGPAAPEEVVVEVPEDEEQTPEPGDGAAEPSSESANTQVALLESSVFPVNLEGAFDLTVETPGFDTQPPHAGLLADTQPDFDETQLRPPDDF
jgi:hypothetical protein